METFNFNILAQKKIWVNESVKIEAESIQDAIESYFNGMFVVDKKEYLEPTEEMLQTEGSNIKILHNGNLVYSN